MAENIKENSQNMIKYIEQLNAIFMKMHEEMKAITLADEEKISGATKIYTNLKDIHQKVSELSQTFGNIIEIERTDIANSLNAKEEKINELKQQVIIPKSSAEATLSKSSAKTPVASTNVWAEKASKVKKLMTSLSIATPARAFGLQLVKQEIAPGVSIDVYIIDSSEKCHDYLGWLCYCTYSKMFWQSVNGVAIQYKVLHINSEKDRPVKFLEHIDAGSKNVSPQHSSFYVPPELDSNSRDERQLTNRMKYVPSECTPGDNQLYIYRVGSRQYLARDLANMSDMDIRQMRDICGSFGLVGIAVEITAHKRVFSSSN